MNQQYPNVLDFFQPFASNNQSRGNNQSDSNQQLKSSPAKTLSQFNRNLEQMFDSFFNSMPGANAMADMIEQFTPQMQMQEEDRKYVISFSIPSVEADDIQIYAKNGMLMVSYENEESNEESDRESAYKSSSNKNSNRSKNRARTSANMSFSKILPLPAMADADNIQANYNDGTLRIKIAKLHSDKANSARIKVNTRSNANNNSMDSANNANQTAGSSNRTSKAS